MPDLTFTNLGSPPDFGFYNSSDMKNTLLRDEQKSACESFAADINGVYAKTDGAVLTFGQLLFLFGVLVINLSVQVASPLMTIMGVALLQKLVTAQSRLSGSLARPSHIPELLLP
jgi:hypothetical protein